MNYSELKERYQLLKDLMDHTPDVIYFKDRKGRLTMVNQAHAKGLGLKPEDVAGKTDFDFFPKERAEKMYRDDLKVMISGKPIIDKIERATRPDGIDNYSSTTKIPRFDSKGRIIGLIGITRDITHRMQLKALAENQEHTRKKLEALEEINRLKSEFVSAVSHELRTPLAIIKDIIGLIFDGLAGSVTAKQKELLIKANNNIARLQSIIEQLLDISRIETGRLKLHYSLVNINDLILDSSQYFKKLAQDKSIKLEYKLPRKGISIFVDTERIIQVMNNLLGNALKFTEEGGRIKVEVRILENKVRVGVIDTGIGVGREDLHKLFNKFMQLSKVTGFDRKGVGLGLSIARDLVEKHNGEIWAESKLGVGSRFYFTLPRLLGIDILNKETKDKINKLLREEKTIFLIHLSIVNFKAIRRWIKIKPLKLFGDLKGLMEQAFKSLVSPSGRLSHTLCLDASNGEYTIILPEGSKEQATKACFLLKEKIDKYFKKNSIMDVFINLGTSSYSSKRKARADSEIMGNFFVRKIYIGFNKRRFERVNYNMQIDVVFPPPENGILPTETVDISQGGICFLSSRPLETDKEVQIKLKLPQIKDSFHIRGRVAWIKGIEEALVTSNKYKVGVEFLGFKDKNRKNFVKFVKSLSIK